MTLSGDRTRPSAAQRRVIAILIGHIALVCAFGQHYAKLDLPLYPTELVLAALVVLGSGGWRSVGRDVVTRRVALFVAIGIGFVVLYGSPSGAGVKAFSFFVYAAFYWIVRGAATTDRARWQILDAIAWACVAAAAFGLWQMKTGSVLIGADRHGPLGFEETSTGSIRWLSGEYGLYGLLGLIIAAARPLAERRLSLRSAGLLAAAGVVLVLAQHRSGLIALVVAVAATGACVLGARRALGGAVRLLALGAVAIAVIHLAIDDTYVADTLVRIQHIDDPQDVNTAWRLLNWYEVGAGVAADPLGHGFGQWDFFFTMYDPLIGSHNSLLDLAYRIGVPGLLVFLTLPLRLLVHTRRLVARAPASEALLPITICACIVALLAYACFNVVLETPHMSIFFWILLGLGAGALDERGVTAGGAARRRSAAGDAARAAAVRPRAETCG